MKLYSFFRSGTSHRLRIALNLKGLAYEQATVDLRREQHLTDAFKAINPGSAPDSTRSSLWSRRVVAPARLPAASDRRWPMSTWCRKSRARGVSRSTWRAGRVS